jgi:RNA polymerase sigma factor (sigma-70 family)
VAELRRLLEELPAGDRRLIELRYFEGLKYREISTSVGLTVSNVGFRLHRVLQQLASRLQSRDLEDDS